MSQPGSQLAQTRTVGSQATYCSCCCQGEGTVFWAGGCCRTGGSEYVPKKLESKGTKHYNKWIIIAPSFSCMNLQKFSSVSKRGSGSFGKQNMLRNCNLTTENQFWSGLMLHGNILLFSVLAGWVLQREVQASCNLVWSSGCSTANSRQTPKKSIWRTLQNLFIQFTFFSIWEIFYQWRWCFSL